MTNTTPAPRKSPQETEIDHLLAEEFHCDPVFSERFAAACGLEFDSLRVIDVVPEPSLEGGGYGGLLVKADMDGSRIALLIEDRITAGPAPRQAEHAGRMRRQGWDRVVTVLVAPGSYRGERDGYEASVDLEAAMEMLHSPDRRRLDWRRDIIGRALRKQASTGVRNPDPALHRLHSDYRQWAEERCAGRDRPCRFPPLEREYHDDDGWIDEIRPPDFPANVWLRHRFWTSIGNATGMVDLIVSPASESERSRLERAAPDWAVMGAYGREGKGIKLSIRVPEMRQSTGFWETVAAEAFEAMERLTAFFLELEWEWSRRPERPCAG